MTPQILAQQEKSAAAFWALEESVIRLEVLAAVLNNITYDVFFSDHNVAKAPSGHTMLTDHEIMMIGGLSDLLVHHTKEAMKHYRGDDEKSA